MPVNKGSFPKIVVLGAASVGKTSIIEQVAYGNYYPEKEMYPTIEDSYDIWVETDRTQKDRVRIYDTKGLDLESPKVHQHYYHIADGFILVFSVTSSKSFQLVEYLKKEIERVRGKDFPIVIMGSKVDLNESRECDHVNVIKWADTEKVKLFEVMAMHRQTLQEPLTSLLKKINLVTGRLNPEKNKIFRKTKSASHSISEPLIS